MSSKNGAEGGIRSSTVAANPAQIDENDVPGWVRLPPENAGECGGHMQGCTQPVQRDHESWRPVLGFEGLYEVSDRGRVRNARSGRVLKPNTISRYGHQQVKLCKDARHFDRLVSRLVLEAFVGSCPPGMQARHVNDPDARNNALDNLAWGTPLENSAARHRRQRQ